MQEEEYVNLSGIPILNKEQLGQFILQVDVSEMRDSDGYLKLINGEIAKAFLSVDDYDIYLDLADYAETVKSFAKRYELNLISHHDHIVKNMFAMLSGSGAVEGQRVTLAKTDIAKSISHGESVQTLQQRAEKKKEDFMTKIANRI